MSGSTYAQVFTELALAIEVLKVQYEESSWLLTSFAVLAAEAIMNILLVLHTVHLSGCAVLQLS